MKKQMITKSQLREAINGLGPLAPDWLVEALEDFIELQEAHKNLLAMHAEDAYHLEEARAKLYAAPQMSPKVAPTVAIDERAEFEKWAYEQKFTLLRDENSGEYLFAHAELAWESWQAARKLSAPEVVSKTTDTVVPDDCATPIPHDEKRIDFLEAHPELQIKRYKKNWSVSTFSNYERDVHKTLREAIDAAMLKGEK